MWASVPTTEGRSNRGSTSPSHARHLGIPETRPWPDDHRSRPLPWAVEDNYRRVNSKYGEELEASEKGPSQYPWLQVAWDLWWEAL